MLYIFLAVIFCLLVLFLWRNRGQSLEFPGPDGWPFIGNFFALGGSREMHEVLYEWALKYGGAYKFSVLGKQYLVISHPDTLHEALVTRGKDFAGRTVSYPIQVMTENYKSIADSSNLGMNKLLRKAVHSTVKTYGSGRSKLAAVLDSAIDDMMMKFAETNGEAVDPMPVLYSATSLSVFLLLCGERLDEMSGLPAAIQELSAIAMGAAGNDLGNTLLETLPFLRKMSSFPACARLQLYETKRDELCDRLIWPALAKAKASDDMTVGKALMDIVGQDYGEGEDAGQIEMINLKQTCLDLLFGGTTSTSTTFYCLINVLQCNPEIQGKIFQEIDGEVGIGRSVALDDKDRLPYCRAVVLEALRYATPFPFGLTHVVRQPTQLSGIAVPVGTEVITNLWACHHDPKLWPEPWTFKPERFLDDDGQLVLADHPNKKQLYPFGAGPRGCVGEVMALNRLFLFLTNSVQKFQFSPPDGAEHVSCDAREYKFGFAVAPPPYKTRAIARN